MGMSKERRTLKKRMEAAWNAKGVVSGIKKAKWSDHTRVSRQTMCLPHVEWDSGMEGERHNQEIPPSPARGDQA